MANSDNDRKLEQLKQKYQPAMNTIQEQGVRLQNVHLQDGKLFLRGVAPSQEAKNHVWDHIKKIDPNYSDLTADITVSESSGSAGRGAAEGRTHTAGASAGGGSHRTYTVQSGDSLSKIAKHFYGDANAYNRIFEANRDKLSDPNKIRPGQELVIPE